MPERVKFTEIFNIHPDGSLEPKVIVEVGGVRLGPGVRFSKGVSFAGIDFTLFVGRDLQITRYSGYVKILGVYS